MRIHFKALNACTTRNAKLLQYRDYLLAQGHELVDDAGAADAVLLWTCAFRADHRDASLACVRSLLDSPARRVVVGGCLPSIAPDLLPAAGERLVVAGWKEDEAAFDRIFAAASPLAAFRPVYVQERICRDARAYRRETGQDATFQDQYIKLVVSEGCNFACTYCSERLAFPAYRSVPPEALARSLCAEAERSGVREAILVADSLGQYGSDLGLDLPALARTLHAAMPGLRLAYNNFHLRNFLDFAGEFAALIREGKVAHLNLPIQSAADPVLARMNRSYGRQDVERAFGLLNGLGFRDFDTHLIVGFPGETESDLEQTLDLVLRARPRYVLASAFMPTPGAPAAALPGRLAPEAMARRQARGQEAMDAAGIIVNCEGGDLSTARIQRLLEARPAVSATDPRPTKECS